ncbi:DNA-binding response regulator, partial [Rhizobium ruizarguesonis]
MNSALIPNLDLRQENLALPLRMENNPSTTAVPGRHTHSLVILDNRELDR